MMNYKIIKDLINKDNINTKFNDSKAITDGTDFRPMSQNTLKQINSLISDDLFNSMKENGDVLTVKDIQKSAYNKMKASAESILCGKSNREIFDSIYNNSYNTSTSLDPMSNMGVAPQIYMSPYEANALYTHGIYNIITSKKAKSVLLNGFHIKNKKLSDSDIEKIEDNCYGKDLAYHIADLITMALIYGGSIIFPMFKHESPITTNMSIGQLIKQGIVKKNCIDYFLKLDRWQTMIVPPYNPTQKHFEFPEKYTIPYLGCDVNADRIARIIPCKLSGFWGTIANQGWGISDFLYYMETEFAYETIQRELPVMVSQMSLLYRKINIDGVLASEGSNALDGLIDESTVRIRQASPENPISMDMLGDVGVIQRDFKGVPELTKLLIKKLCAEAKIYEPTIFTQDKGNFASGDDTQGILMKQYENNMLVYKELEPQLRRLAKLMVIDSLGTSDRVMEALPYTKFEFNSPIAVNALDKAKIGESFSKIVLNLSSSRVPIATAVDIADEYVDNKDIVINKTLREDLKKIQAKNDRYEEEEHNSKVGGIEQKNLTNPAERQKDPVNDLEKQKVGARRGESRQQRLAEHK